MYWEFAVLARKLGIVAVAVGLANTNAYQLAMMLLVLFVAFVVQVCWLMGGEGEKDFVVQVRWVM